MLPVLVILASKKRGGLILPGRIKGAEIFQHTVELLIDVWLLKMEHATRLELMRLGERLNKPVDVFLNATTGVLGR